MIDPSQFITLFSTPRSVRDLQTFLQTYTPDLNIDGIFGPATGKAFGDAYIKSKLPLEWESEIPTYESMHFLQQIITCDHPIACDGYFGPVTGEALGQLIFNGDYIPHQTVNDDAIAILKQLEGDGLPRQAFYAYSCPTGIPTIGWGHTATVTAKDVETQRIISEEEADELLQDDLIKFHSILKLSLKYPIGPNMFSACVLLVYNIGVSGFVSSTVLRELNARNYQAAADAFLLWNKGTVDGEKVEIPGLTRRREIEKELFERDL